MNTLVIATAAAISLFTTTAMAINIDDANIPLGQAFSAADLRPFDAEEHSADSIIFPATGDEISTAQTYYWNEGDSVTGVRVLSEGADGVTGAIVLDLNNLTCDTQDHVFTVDGQVITSFSITDRDSQIFIDASFPAIGPGEHTFAITTTETVDNGCGSANFALDVSVLDFDSTGDTGGPSCASAGEMPLGTAATLCLALVLGVGIRRRS